MIRKERIWSLSLVVVRKGINWTTTSLCATRSCPRKAGNSLFGEYRNSYDSKLGVVLFMRFFSDRYLFKKLARHFVQGDEFCESFGL